MESVPKLVILEFWADLFTAQRQRWSQHPVCKEARRLGNWIRVSFVCHLCLSITYSRDAHRISATTADLPTYSSLLFSNGCHEMHSVTNKRRVWLLFIFEMVSGWWVYVKLIYLAPLVLHASHLVRWCYTLLFSLPALQLVAVALHQYSLVHFNWSGYIHIWVKLIYLKFLGCVSMAKMLAASSK